MGPGVKPLDVINQRKTDGFISNKFRKLDYYYDKANFKFIFEKELEQVKKKYGIPIFAKELCAALLRKNSSKE